MEQLILAWLETFPIEEDSYLKNKSSRYLINRLDKIIGFFCQKSLKTVGRYSHQAIE